VKYSDPSGYYQMSEQDQKDYPGFTSFVKGVGDTARKDETVWKSMKANSGLNDAELTEALTFGKGPFICIMDTNDFEPAKFFSEIPKAIFINRSAVDGYEGNDYGSLSGGILKLYTEMFLLHETVHYGDYKKFRFKNKKDVEQAGIQFNLDAYGTKDCVGPYHWVMDPIWQAVNKRR